MEHWRRLTILPFDLGFKISTKESLTKKDQVPWGYIRYYFFNDTQQLQMFENNLGHTNGRTDPLKKAST